MRVLFLTLALANAAFFAYDRLGRDARADGEAQILAQQLNRDKIRLLLPGQVSTLSRRPEAQPVAQKAVALCIEWGAFGGDEAVRAAQALAPLSLGARLTQRRQEDVAGYWVYIPPLANRQAAARKAGELKSLRVDDYFVVPDDPKWRNAVSLGVFKTEDAAKARLAALRDLGVKSAVVGPRESQTGKSYFRVEDANPALLAKLKDLSQGFAGTGVRECAAGEKKG
jgi:hypothetical protein